MLAALSFIVYKINFCALFQLIFLGGTIDILIIETSEHSYGVTSDSARGRRTDSILTKWLYYIGVEVRGSPMLWQEMQMLS